MNYSPPAVKPASTTSPGAAGQIGELCGYEVRWPDDRRFDSRRRIDEHQARLLVEGGICKEVRSPSGILRYLMLHRPSVKKFATILAQGNFTIATSGNLHEHVISKGKGL